MATNGADGGDVSPSLVSSKTQSENLANWMGNLPAHLLDVPLHRLAIPGE